MLKIWAGSVVILVDEIVLVDTYQAKVDIDTKYTTYKAAKWYCEPNSPGSSDASGLPSRSLIECRQCRVRRHLTISIRLG